MISTSKSKFFLSLVLFTLAEAPVGAVSPEELKRFLDKTEKRLELEDKSPDRFEFPFSDTSPNQITKDNLNHLIFLFCAHYLEKHHSNFVLTRNRTDIKTLQEKYYPDQAQSLLNGKLSFSCYTVPKVDREQLKIDFNFRNGQFFPFRWDYFKPGDVLFFSEEDESGDGRKDSFTRFQNKGCPLESNKDRKGTGIIEEWWFYENCSLVRIEYDENQNGYRERTCFYNLGKVKFCEGIGEKEEAKARIAKEKGNKEEASLYFGLAIREILKENPTPVFRTCALYREKILLDYETQNFSGFQEAILGFLNNRYCEKNSLEILVYKGFYELYGAKDYKSAIQSYQKAGELYVQQKGEPHPDIVLNLALAYLQSGDSFSCLLGLDTLEEKTLPLPQSFYYAYFRGSCYLERNEDTQALVHLKKAWDRCPERETLGLLALKLSIAEERLGNSAQAKQWLLKSQYLGPDFEKNRAYYEEKIQKTLPKTP